MLIWQWRPPARSAAALIGGVLRLVGELFGRTKYAGNTGWLRFRWDERELLESWDPEQPS